MSSLFWGFGFLGLVLKFEFIGLIFLRVEMPENG